MSVIDRTKLRTLRAAIDTALKEVAEEHGVHLKCGNARFSDTNASFKLEVATIDSDGKVMTKVRADFIELAGAYGLTPDMLDKEFTYGNEQFVLIGLKAKAHRYPLLVKKLRTGQTFKFPVDIAKFIKSS